MKSLFVIVYFALLANCMHKNNLFIINLITCIVVKFCLLQSGSYLPKAISSSLNYFLFFLYFIGFFHIVHYNIENWVWNLAGLELSPLCAACCRLVSSLENMLASSCDYPQLNCHSADMEFQQPVL